MPAAPQSWVRLIRAKQLLKSLVSFVRRGQKAVPFEPGQRRLVLLQIDGLSSARLRAAMARGEMPHLDRWLASGAARLRSIEAATPPSTPVFQAGLLYGEHADVPGFGWYDRRLQRTVRMDLAEDVRAIEGEIHACGRRRPLLQQGVSYGTIWPGGAATGFFNVVWFLHGRTGRQIAHNLYDRTLTLAAGAAITGRMAARFLLELGVGVWDFQRWCRRIQSTRFEWRFLYMRLFVSVVLRDVATQGAIVDILRGVPAIYIDFLGYDEYAHRRGPDAEMALYNLKGIDASIHKILRATRAVPENGYDVFVFSDHGQSATLPFERIMRRDLHEFVLEHAAGSSAGAVDAPTIRELVAVRENEFWIRTLWRPLRAPMQLYAWWLKRRLQGSLGDHHRDIASLDAIEVVTGGSVAHLYFGRERPEGLTVEEIGLRWPRLLEALVHCPAVGLVAGVDAHGPVVFHRGARYRLSDRRALEKLEPFRRLGYDLLRGHLEEAARGRRSGDLVLYGAFSEAGNIAFDFEFGSHGGIAPEELDQFVVHPSSVDFPLSGAVRAEEFYEFFHRTYQNEDPRDNGDREKHAA
jgi:hypothetical protein